MDLFQKCKDFTLVKDIKEVSNKKVLFITATEQLGLRYLADFEKLFNIKPLLLHYQNISPYETMRGNDYDYQKQMAISIAFGVINYNISEVKNGSKV